MPPGPRYQRKIRRLTIITAALVLGVGAPSAPARPVRTFTPEELTAQAEVVCNGIPLQIEPTADTARLSLNLDGSNALPVRLFSARVRVLGGCKGSAPAEITVRYPALDERGGAPVSIGPLLIGLAPGKRYRFYLKPRPDKPGEYTGVLDGSFDDGAAVEPLADDEPDDGPPLFRARAEQLAAAYVKKVRLGYAVETVHSDAHYGLTPAGFPGWQVSFWSKAPLSYPPCTGDAKVTVCPAGSIVASSWVGAGLPVPPGSALPGLRGKWVRMTVERKIARDGRLVPSGAVSTLLGRVQKVSRTSVGGQFFEEGWNQPPKAMQVSRRDLQSIQPLAGEPMP